MKTAGWIFAILVALAAIVPAAAAPGDVAAPLPDWLLDRGTGLPTSLFGTYIREGELYLKRLSPRWRAVVALEGEDEDLSLITEAQYFITPRIFLKINSGFGLSQKVPDFAPEIGLMMNFDAQR